MLYRCEFCNFETPLKGNLSKHLKTRKHSFNLKRKLEMNQNEPKSAHLVHRKKSPKNTMNQNEPKLVHLAHEPNEPKTAHRKRMKKNEKKNEPNEPNEPKLVHPKKNKKNKNENQSPDLNKLKLNLKCHYCFKEFSSKPSKRRHELHRCKKKTSESVVLMDELKKQTQLVKQLLEEKASQYEAVLNEKEKYIDILRDKMSSTTNHNTFNIIRNNIYTMKPLQFLNTFCINNPSLEQVVNCIQDSDLNEEEIQRIKEASQLDAKHIIAKEFDSILKKHNQELIQDKPLTCGNVLFSNDGSNRRYIAKGNCEWQFYSSDEKLDTSTQVIMDKFNGSTDKPVHMSKKERGMVHRHLKNMNDFNKSRDALLNALENKDQDLLEHFSEDKSENSIVSIQDIDESDNQLETLIESYTDYNTESNGADDGGGDDNDGDDGGDGELEYDIEEDYTGESDIEVSQNPEYDKQKKYNIILDCGQEHYYDDDNNVFNKQTKTYIGIRVHDDDCDCENEDECWYYVKYLDEL